MSKIYIGLTSDEWNTLHRLLEWELERQDSGEEDYETELKNIINAILNEVKD
jgi:hypothetical protein